MTKSFLRSGPKAQSLDVHRDTEAIIIRSKTKRTFAKWQVFTIVRRLAAIAAAIQYVYVSMSATWWALQVLSDAKNPTETLRVSPSELIEGYLGDGLIRDSPLVQDILGGDTTPRDSALFLESATMTSTENCSALPLFQADIYNYDFLSRLYLGMVENTKYNVTTLANLELVLVVVDCSFKQIQTGDPSSIRVYNLVRLHQDPSHTYLITMSLNVQEYKLRNHNKRGPALVGMLTLRDENVEQFYMVATTYPFQRSPNFEAYEYVGVTSDSYLELRSIPRDPATEPVKHLITARKRGFFSGESQANFRVMYSLLTGLSAKTALTRWEWIGASTTVDSWAWVHCIHFFFGMETVYSLVVLFFVTYDKFRSGKVWIGDPFSSVSTANLVGRGILVILSCFLDSFWSVNEYAMSRASMLSSSSSTLRVHREFMHADIMVVFLSLVGFISAFFQERIDPAVAIALFELVHAYRLLLLRSSSAVVSEVTTYSSAQNKLGIAEVTPTIAAMSPLRLWSSFQFPTKDPTFLAASFFPTIYLLVGISCFALMRKLYRVCYPEQTRQRSSQSTDTSGNEKAAMSQKGIVTNFELATGAELQARFGIISDYSNYVYFKGMKFASADGVYCSGYVIVNGKLLVSIKHLLAIAMMKLFHARFTNVYAYEVDGNTVRDTARLVYPHTLQWSDLWRLSVTVLL